MRAKVRACVVRISFRSLYTLRNRSTFCGKLERDRRNESTRCNATVKGVQEIEHLHDDLHFQTTNSNDFLPEQEFL